MTRFSFACSFVGLVVVAVLLRDVNAVGVSPSTVDIALGPGDTFHLTKTVTTPEIPPVVDICLVEDETGSFFDDIANLQALAPTLVAALDGSGSDYATCVIGFRDFARNGWGSSGDHVYRRYTDVAVGGGSLSTGVTQLSANGGNDGPEAQLEALHYLATPGHAAIDSNGDGDVVDPEDTAAGLQPSWRSSAQRVVLLATDASCHSTGDAGGWPGDGGTTSAAGTGALLAAAGVHVIGLTPGGSGAIPCVDSLAYQTGGSVQSTTSSGSDVVDAILAGLEELTTDVWWHVDYCDPGLDVSLEPAVRFDVPGATDTTFEESIEVTSDPDVSETLHCTVSFISNEYPAEGTVIGEQTIWVRVLIIDIKPGSFPNSINPKSNGVVPVAILGGATFDVTEVDADSLAFGPAGATRAHTSAHVEDVNGDGFDDLVTHYRQKQTGLAPGDVKACLTGLVGGVAFEACDSVRVLDH